MNDTDNFENVTRKEFLLNASEKISYYIEFN